MSGAYQGPYAIFSQEEIDVIDRLINGGDVSEEESAPIQEKIGHTRSATAEIFRQPTKSNGNG